MILTNRLAALVFLSLTGLALVFHLLILFQVIPYTIVWGGRLRSEPEMYQFEIVSILVNLLFSVVVLIRGQFLPIKRGDTFVSVLLWLMCGVFVLNTVGNLFALNMLERIIFTPITLLLAYCCFVMARNKTTK